MQVASKGLSLDAYENVVQNDKYNLHEFVTSLGGECFAFCWDEVLISSHFTTDPEGRPNFLFLYIGLCTFHLG